MGIGNGSLIVTVFMPAYTPLSLMGFAQGKIL
jgi:hypothetical protein